MHYSYFETHAICVFDFLDLNGMRPQHNSTNVRDNALMRDDGVDETVRKLCLTKPPVDRDFFQESLLSGG